MSTDGQNVSAYFNQRDQHRILEPFEEAVEGKGRSQGIKDAMKLYTQVASALEGTEFEHMLDDPVELGIWVRQAVLSYYVFETSDPAGISQS